MPGGTCSKSIGEEGQPGREPDTRLVVDRNQFRPNIRPNIRFRFRFRLWVPNQCFGCLNLDEKNRFFPSKNANFCSVFAVNLCHSAL